MSMPPQAGAPMPPMQQPMTQKPGNHLVMAIISVFFCWPIAIYAIVKSTSVDKLWMAGDANGATAAAASAKKASIAAYIVGVVLYVIVIIANVILAGAVATSVSTY